MQGLYLMENMTELHVHNLLSLVIAAVAMVNIGGLRESPQFHLKKTGSTGRGVQPALTDDNYHRFSVQLIRNLKVIKYIE
ncbi:hypothetical protein DPMN_178848 [Dreissena polymorpha]|uniref:Uncharacterized protein n=1 Tax=Dreissena polymorpha TaxID=45954 RepID=A0A9D4EFU3_DREPO|nr:hypothetical protein DPMN_178848 [Dreissena polymorpha]